MYKERPTKETYKRDLHTQKRPTDTKETYTDILLDKGLIFV